MLYAIMIKSMKIKNKNKLSTHQHKTCMHRQMLSTLKRRRQLIKWKKEQKPACTCV